MSNEAIKTQAQDLMQRGQDLVEEGNQRQLVFLSKAGNPVVQTKLTIAAGVGAFLLITGIVSLPLVIIASVIAYMMGIRAEIRQLTS